MIKKKCTEEQMELNDLSVDEALKIGVITKDSWFDESWDVQMPAWRRALELAEKCHRAAGSTYIDKTRELRIGKDKPYIEFVQKLLDLLIHEVHLERDTLLTVAVILSILVDTFISKISLTMQPGPKIDSISGA